MLFRSGSGTTGKMALLNNRKFMEAGFKQWGKKMQDDISDGVRYLISESRVDRIFWLKRMYRKGVVRIPASRTE